MPMHWIHLCLLLFTCQYLLANNSHSSYGHFVRRNKARLSVNAMDASRNVNKITNSVSNGDGNSNVTPTTADYIPQQEIGLSEQQGTINATTAANQGAACPPEAGNVCPEGTEWTTPKGYCYWGTVWTSYENCVWLSDKMMNKTESLDYCSERGGTMLDIHSVSEGDFTNIGKALSMTIGSYPIWLNGITRRHRSIEGYGECAVAVHDSSRESYFTYKQHLEGCSKLAYALCHSIRIVGATKPPKGISSEQEPPKRNRRFISTVIRGNSSDALSTNAVYLGESQNNSDGCLDDTTWKKCPATGYCYKVVTDHAMSWTQAREYCQSQEGELTSIHGEEEMEFIMELLNKETRKRRYWIGLTQDPKETWSDSTRVNFTKFKGIRDNYKFREDCVLLSMNYQGGLSDYYWLFSYCGGSNAFICKANPRCSYYSSGYHYNGICYWKPCCDRFTWSKGQQYCKKHGANMVSIQSEEELTYVRKMVHMHERIWIGLFNEPNKAYDSFQWTDGSGTDFIKLHGIQDTRVHDSRTCGLFVGPYKEILSTVHCEWKIPIVCKGNDIAGRLWQDDSIPEEESHQSKPIVPVIQILSVAVAIVLICAFLYKKWMDRRKLVSSSEDVNLENVLYHPNADVKHEKEIVI